MYETGHLHSIAQLASDNRQSVRVTKVLALFLSPTHAWREHGRPAAQHTAHTNLERCIEGADTLLEHRHINLHRISGRRRSRARTSSSCAGSHAVWCRFRCVLTTRQAA